MFIKQYIASVEEELKELQLHIEAGETELALEKWQAIKQISDEIVEGWLHLEDMMVPLQDKMLSLQKKAHASLSMADVSGLEEAIKELSSPMSPQESKPSGTQTEYPLQFRRGQGFFHLQMYSEAAGQFEQRLNDDPDDEPARLYYAIAQYRQGNVDEAWRSCQLLIATAEDGRVLSMAYQISAHLLTQEKQYDRAMLHYKKAFQLDAADSDIAFNIGALYYYQEEYEKSIESFKYVLQLQPDDWEAMLFVSYSLVRLGHCRKALQFKRQAAEVSRHPKSEYTLAQAFEREGIFDHAITSYRNLVRSSAYSAASYNGIAWSFLLSDATMDARSWLLKGLAIYPSDGDLMLNYIAQLAVAGEQEKMLRIIHSEAIEHIAAAVTPFNMLRLLRLFFIHDSHNTAKVFSDAENTAHFYLVKHDFSAALQHYSRLTSLPEAKREWHFFTGICQSRLGDISGARQSMTAWLANK